MKKKSKISRKTPLKVLKKIFDDKGVIVTEEMMAKIKLRPWCGQPLAIGDKTLFGMILGLQDVPTAARMVFLTDKSIEHLSTELYFLGFQGIFPVFSYSRMKINNPNYIVTNILISNIKCPQNKISEVINDQRGNYMLGKYDRMCSPDGRSVN